MLNLTALCSISAFNPTNHRTAQNYSPVSLFDHNTQSFYCTGYNLTAITYSTMYSIQSHCSNCVCSIILLNLTYYASVMLHTTARLTARAQSHCSIELLNPNTLPYCSILLFNLSAHSYCSILQINSVT